MNTVLEEMMAIFAKDEETIMHYGMPRRSGRYPYGSGENPYQHSLDFLGRVETLKKSGWTETPENIKKEFGMTTTQYRAQKSIAKDERRKYDVARAKSLKEDGLSPTEIARKMSTADKTINESTVRSWLNTESETRMNKAKETAEFIKKQINEKGMIDVGNGVERELNISKEKLNQALSILEAEGYPIYKGGIPQATNPGQQTNQKVICPPGTEHKAIYDFANVHSLNEYISRDGGETFESKFHYPESMDSNRLMIRYKEDGGINKDGIVEIRRGVEDLSLGESRYAQVRILVDGTHYIKGMAVYSDGKDMPPGVDVIFNTNKGKEKTKMEVLKEIKDDPDNPFGSAIKDVNQGGQYWYEDKKTGEKKLGLINKRADEGDWTEWKDALPSQFLSKQNKALAEKQLNLAKADKYAEFDEIKSLTNPTVKKHLLEKFADECDAAAVNLQAAALPGQKYHVIIPTNSLKENEVFAPNYENGTKLALVRYPHGGTFEIPILTVNNNNLEGRKVIGTDSIDAVGIRHKVAERLSGADFDGDTVMCIPTHDKSGKVKITSTPPLKGLEGFEPKESYPEKAGMKYMKDPKTGKDSTQMEMGKISNLITDMTLGGATDDELARAVRHSMVVIDAGKHKLDYKQSEIDNNISALKQKYQMKVDENGKVTYGGASTLISKAKGEVSVDKRQGSYKINLKGNPDYDPSKPEGAKIWKTADDLYYPDRSYDKTTGTVSIKTNDGRKITYDVNDAEARKRYTPVKRTTDTGDVYYTDSTGSITYRRKNRTQASTRMAETEDANSLVSHSRHQMELLYANYANSMKALGNQARLELASTPNLKYNKEAARTYKSEVSSLMSKLNNALLNTTRERQAQRMANAEVQSKKKAYEENTGAKMKPGDVKKASQQALSKSRIEVGSVSRRERSIKITDKEWTAIQKGAISENKLKQILNNADVDSLRQRATPRSTNELSAAKISRIKAMSASNYTLSEIADKLGVSTSTVYNYL